MKADVICAWCDEFMHVGETPDGEPAPGICPPCVRAYFPEVAPALDLPDPTPIPKTTPAYQYVHFGLSKVYHLTDDTDRTLCHVLIEGYQNLYLHAGVVTKLQPPNRRLCTHCQTVITSLPG